MSILRLPKASPVVVIFDWHGTLVDTHDAMYHAVDDVLPRLEQLGLTDCLLPVEHSKTLEDAKLLKYIRQHKALDPRVKHERRVSRTDIFELLFGNNETAKRRAHKAFDDSYKNYVDQVLALEPDATQQLLEMKRLGLVLGLISNRRLDYLKHELLLVENGDWQDVFSLVVSGSEVPRRKPAADVIDEALSRLGIPASLRCWYVGDSSTDVIAADAAGVTSIFYNGAGWSQAWLDKLFPDTVSHPYRPDAVVTSLEELLALLRLSLAQQLRIERSAKE